MEAEVERRVRGNAVYFTVRWSRLRKADKYSIATSVPSMGGVYELYYRDDHKRLVLLERAPAWYGGVRSQLRRAIDPELEEDIPKRRILEEYDLYYRYSLLESQADMSDIIYFFDRTDSPHGKVRDDSGRFETIFLKELSEDKIFEV